MKFAQLTLFLVTSSLPSLVVSKKCKSKKSEPCVEPGNVQVLSASVDSTGDLTSVLDLFSSMLGGIKNTNGVAVDPDGHRRINWDGAAVPLDMPGNFFASGTLDRGLTVSSDENEFAVSNPIDGSDNLFDSINPDVVSNLVTFSAPRLFSPVKDTTIELTFTVPGVGSEAYVGGFGAFFVDVDAESGTELVFLDKDGCEIVSKLVEPNPSGLSFLGMKLDEKVVAKVEVKLGTEPLEGDESNDFTRGRRALRKGRKDIVVMDDFLYDEPKAKEVN